MTTGLNHGYGGVKVNKKLNVKGFCTDLAYDLVGSVLYAAGIVCFVNPANMAPGGMSGVAILLNYLWGLPIGTMTIVLNIPLLILSYIFLGKSLTWKTVKSLVISSLMVDLVMARYAPIYAGDRMIGGVFGGVLMGAGLAIIFLRYGYYFFPCEEVVSTCTDRPNDHGGGLHYHWCICPCIRQSGICPVWSDFPVLLFYGH